MENRIKAILQEKGLRMADLAARVGMGQSNLMASLRNNPKLSTLEEICKALGIDLAELFGGKIEKSDGIIIIKGETYSLSKPTPYVVQLPVYSDYSILRYDIKKFIRTSIKEQVASSICGMVENFEYFTLVYYHDREIDNYATPYDKFTLTICFGNKQVWMEQYDVLEYTNKDKMEWDIPAVSTDIINDIEGYVLGQLDKDLKPTRNQE